MTRKAALYIAIVAGSVVVAVAAAEIYLRLSTSAQVKLPFYNHLYPYIMFRGIGARGLQECTPLARTVTLCPRFVPDIRASPCRGNLVRFKHVSRGRTRTGERTRQATATARVARMHSLGTRSLPT